MKNKPYRKFLKLNVYKAKFIWSPILMKNYSSSSFGKHSLQVRHKQDWGREFILLLSQAAVLPGSNASSNGV